VDTGDEVVQGLGIRIIGALPRLPNRVRRPGGSVSMSNRDRYWQQLLTESIDATRTMLLHTAEAEGLSVVMITSAVGGEGKTSLSSHLATSLARAGRRTLLVDCDLRRPTVHRLFDVPLEPGFSEVLRGDATPEAATLTSTASGLALMPAGRCDPRSLEALSQNQAAAIFSQLKQQYDFVIIDTSPVLPVSDTLLVARHVDGVLFSIMRDVSRMPMVYAAYQRLAGVGIRPLGAVVCGARREYYGSSYRYGYGYGYGYGNPPTQAAAVPAAPPAAGN
jgi:capsular exopolysaccharide synthesis family protein